jgi:hypothetical protein
MPHDRPHVHPLVRYFITGAPLWGAGDNATFWHHATVDHRGKPYIRLSGPRWQRLARRHLAITVPLATAMAIPWTTLWPLAIYMATLAMATLWWTVATVASLLATRRAIKEWVDPAAKVLFTLTGTRWTPRAGRAAIELPPGWGKDAGDQQRPAVRVHLPVHVPLNARLKQQITENVGARLGIPAPVQGDWREAGEHVSVDLMGAPLPPKEVTFAGLRKAIEQAADHEVVLGRKAQGHIAKASLIEDSPHFIMSGAAGTGKSALARLLMVQRAMRGDGLIILDPKRFSQWGWAGGGKLSKDQVIYAYRDEDLHDTWMAIGEEIKRRIELDEEELEHQRRVIVMVEEANVQAKKLARYWRGLRKEIILAAKQAQADDAPFDPADLDPPLQSPAIVAMQESVCMGRELKMHVIVAAQRASASIFGGNGGDIRESFQGGRFVARWDRKLWKMLVDTIDYVACPSKERGVWGMATATGFEVFRVPYLEEKEALAILAGHQVASGPVLGQGWPGGEVATGHVAKALASGVTLASAVGQLPGRADGQAVTLAALRKAAGRPGFPEPVAKADGTPYGSTEARLYDLDELIAWCGRSS